MMSRREAIRSLAAGWAALVGARTAGAAAQETTPELLIRRGRVVNADGARDLDVRIVGETIDEIGARLVPRRAESRVIDASGRLVLPGGVDPHTHLHPPFADDLTSGSMAALAGGITTVGTFVGAQEGDDLREVLERSKERVQTEAIADVFLHVVAWPPSPDFASRISTAAELGQPSFKIFTPALGGRVAELIRHLEAARDAGVVTMVHCEDEALLEAGVRRLEAEGRTSLRDYGASRPVVAEVAATQQLCVLCESTGAPIHIVHLSSARALEACRAARRAGLPLYVETRPLYLHLTAERMDGPDGPLHVGQPPLREEHDRQALWRGLGDGTIDVLATDHAPWTRAQKMDPALSITNLRPGMSDLQSMLPMYFSEGVRGRDLSLQRFVATTSTNAARIFGLYPGKGAIREGSDADIAIWDPDQLGTVTAAADLSQSDFSVYDGWKVKGWPVMTIRRGAIVYEDGRIAASAGSGRLIQRRRWSADDGPSRPPAPTSGARS
jgi:dihydropyrimidinase